MLRAETRLLKVSVVAVLLFEGARNGLSGTLRLYDPQDFGPGTQAGVFGTLNTLLIAALVLFILATLRLERDDSFDERNHPGRRNDDEGPEGTGARRQDD